MLRLQTTLPASCDADIETAFEQVITSKKRVNTDSLYKDTKKGKKRRKVAAAAPAKDENYIPYVSADKHTEDGLAINSFEQQAKNAEFSISNKVEEQSTFRPGQKKWDRIKKKMVPVVDPRAKKIRTESGIWIPATYKTNRYADWKEKTKVEEQVHRELHDEGRELQQHPNAKFAESRFGRHNAKFEAKKVTASVNGRRAPGSELKSADQIVRERMRLDVIKRKESTNKIKKAASRKKHAKRVKAKGKGARK